MGLNTGGYIFVALAWSIIITLTVYCFQRVIKSERKH